MRSYLGVFLVKLTAKPSVQCIYGLHSAGFCLRVAPATSLQRRCLHRDWSPSRQAGMCGICVRGMNGGSSCGAESAGGAGRDTCPQ